MYLSHTLNSFYNKFQVNENKVCCIQSSLHRYSYYVRITIFLRQRQFRLLYRDFRYSELRFIPSLLYIHNMLIYIYTIYSVPHTDVIFCSVKVMNKSFNTHSYKCIIYK